MYNNHTRHPPPHQMYAPPVSHHKPINFFPQYQGKFHSTIFSNFQTNYKGGNSSSIGSGPQFYTKPPSAIPSNQTIEFDDGPKITVFIGEIQRLVAIPKVLLVTLDFL